MGSLFADSDFGDSPVESQFTLGTISLLGIFFGLVMVCGMFFGFGYSLGRRSTTNSASVPSTTPTAAPVKTSPAVTEPIAPDDESRAALTPAAPTTTPSAPLLANASEAQPKSAQAAAAPLLIAKAAAPAVANPSAQSIAEQIQTTPHYVLDAQVHIPKPSAIQPSLDQPNTHIPLLRAVPGPQFTAKDLPSPYFVWTPPFDVSRRHGVTHRVYQGISRPPAGRGLENASYSGASQPYATATIVNASLQRMGGSGPATVVQIAAMSREDDAEVMASDLRKHGYAPSIKSGVEDALYHVEVGPFSRNVAFATQQRLLAKGYNAVLK